MLNALQKATNDFHAKKFSRMNTRSNHEHTMFVPPLLFAQLQ